MILKNFKVSWKKEEFENLQYNCTLDYGEPNMLKYHHHLYQNIIGNCVYSLPNKMPKFVDKIIDTFQYKIKAPAINLMKPGQILPLHKDLYTKFKNKYDVNQTDDIHRYIIFLEDAKPGHFMQIENEIITKWNAGDLVSWKGEIMHGAYNLGYENRYTLQLTCVDNI